MQYNRLLNIFSWNIRAKMARRNDCPDLNVCSGFDGSYESGGLSHGGLMFVRWDCVNDFMINPLVSFDSLSFCDRERRGPLDLWTVYGFGSLPINPNITARLIGLCSDLKSIAGSWRYPGSMPNGLNLSLDLMRILICSEYRWKARVVSAVDFGRIESLAAQYVEIVCKFRSGK